MDAQFFKQKEDRLWWTEYFRNQIDEYGRRCAVWITEQMADGHVYNLHPQLWKDDGRNIECYWLIDTDRFGAVGVNLLFKLTGVVTPDNTHTLFELISGVSLSGQSQRKVRIETADPFAHLTPETFFSWVTEPNGGMSSSTNELGMEAQPNASPMNAPPVPGSDPEPDGLEQASLQDLLDALRQKIGGWQRFDHQVQRRLRHG